MASTSGKGSDSGIDHNIILLTDSYKVTHWKQYPPGTEKVYSYFESRGGKFDQTVFFGLQYLLKKHLEGAVVTREMIDEAEAIVEKHLGSKGLFNREGWEYILEKHGGRLPISIKAVPEGTVVPTHNVLMTVENTDPKCYWLTNYIETLLVQAWYPITVATLSMNMKRLITKYADDTGDPKLVDFKLHDFGFRGVSSVESAAIGGAAHLVNFKGTDTMAGLLLLRRYYGAEMAGFSIPAAEHSTITSWGRDGEADAMANMLRQFPSGTVAVVSDSYNIFKACEDIWGDKLKDMVMGRDGTLVVRPDSGKPEEVVVKVLDILGKKFGATRNGKGYMVLPDKIRVIQGDGIDLESTERILAAMKSAGWSTDNIAFGMGGALLQRLDRDTQKFAFKASSVTVGSVERDVFKQPVTDPGKDSKSGRLKLVAGSDGSMSTVRAADAGADVLVEVFRNGKVLREYDLSEVRERVSNFLSSERSARTAALLRHEEAPRQVAAKKSMST